MSEFEDFNSFLAKFGSRDFLEFMFKNSPNFIIANDLSGNFVYTNKDFVGYSENELKSKNLLNFVHPDDRDNMTNLLAKIVELGSLNNIECQVLHKNGQYVYLSTNGTLIKDKLGEPIGVLNSIHDITDKKEAEEKLVKSQKFYKSLFENMIDGFAYHRIVLDNTNRPIDYIFMEINEAFTKITGLTRDILGKRVTEVLPGIENDPADWIGRYGVISLNPEKSIIFESEAVPLNKTFLVHAYSPEKGYFVAIFTDITERKKTEEDRLKLLKLESLSLLAGGIAHDYNNLLTSILGNVNLIQLEHKGTETCNTNLTSIENAVFRAKELTNQLLTFSKGGDPIKKPVSVREIIDEAILFSLVGSKSKAIITDRQNIYNILADEGQISQVINNLLINADQAMENGGIININISEVSIPPEKINELNEGNYVKIAIKDTGTGIPKNNMTHIFDPYFSTKKNGTGLGLATSYSIIKKHNGIIKVSSEINVGSTFEIYLPSTNINTTQKDQKIENNDHFYGKILFMDDDKDIQVVMEKMLSKMGFEVEVASDGETAFKMYNDAYDIAPFDLVILDLIIPGGLGGKETLDLLLSVNSNVLAIASSGYSNDQILSDYDRYGFKGRIIKPFTYHNLKNTIAETLNRKLN